MVEALIIDACRTPRGVGKAGKGALSDIHPQQLGATVLQARFASAPASTPPRSTTSFGAPAPRLASRPATSAACRRWTQAMTCGRAASRSIASADRASPRQPGCGLDHVGRGGSRDRRRHRKDVDGDAARRRPVDDGLGQSAAPRQASAVAPGRLRRRDRDT